MFKSIAHLEHQGILPGDFFLPFCGKLDEENRWVKLAALVPWAHAEKTYGVFFKDTLRGQQTISLRKGLGATDHSRTHAIERSRDGRVDRGKSLHAVLHRLAMMTHFRKRLTGVLAEINTIIATEGAKRPNDDDDDPDSIGGTTARTTKRSCKRTPADLLEQQELALDPVDNTDSETVPVREQPMEVSVVQESAASELPASDQEPQAVAAETASSLPNQGTLLVDATCALRMWRIRPT